MPPERRDPTDPSEWLRRARSNLARAKAHCGLDEVLYEDLCFDAQQAAEKSVKALLLHKKVPFTRTHDILSLLTLLDQSGVEVPEKIRQVDILTAYAVDTRYPGQAEDVTREEYLQAINLAERVVSWADLLVRQSPDRQEA